MPRLSRRHLLAMTLVAPSLALAQDARVMTLVAPFPAGGATDAMARIIAEHLAAILRRPVVVENQAGAGGRIAARAVKAATPDGSRLLLANTAVMVLNPLAFADAGYAPADFAPVAGTGEFAIGLATGPMTGARDVSALTAWVRANPARAIYGVPAVGSLPHLAGLAFGRAAGVALIMAPYRGGAPIATDLIGGQIAMGLSAAADFAAVHQAGQLRIVAVTGSARAPSLPDVPTFAEAGIAGLEANAWNGLFAPAGTPDSVITSIAAAVKDVLSNAEVRRRLEAIALVPTVADAAAMTSWIARDRATYAPLLAAAGPLQ